MDLLVRMRRVLVPRRSHLEGWLQRAVFEPLRSLRKQPLTAAEADARRAVRRELGGAESRTGEGRPRILYLLHDAGGGVAWTHRDLLSRVGESWEGFVLTGSLHRLWLSRWDPAAGRLSTVETWWPGRAWSHARYRDARYRRIYEQIVDRLGVDLVHVRHLLGHTLDVLDLSRERGLPLVMSFHDFYAACPSVHLLDDHGVYCGGVCTPDLGQCRLPIDWLDDLPVLKSGPLAAWRRAVAAALPADATFVTTSQSARGVMEKVYPQIAVRVIEHGRDFERAASVAVAPSAGLPARILVAGNAGYHKGSDYLRRLVALDRRRGRRLEVHVLGRADRDAEAWAVCHGPYERGEFRPLATEVRPSFAGVFSVWPETYSHTLTEAWSVGLPVLATDLGAPSERITERGGGWLLPPDDVEAAYERITAVLDDPEEYHRRTAEAHVQGLPSVDDMAEAYLAIYDEAVKTLGREDVSGRSERR